MTDPRDRLDADLAAAEAEVSRLRADNAELAEGFRVTPTDDAREELKRAAASLAAARDRVLAAKAVLRVFEKTGSEHGLVAEEGRVVGTIAVALGPGISRADREKAIAYELSDRLDAAAAELGVLLATSPERFTRERPGRDSEGKTVLDVVGRVEGDVLVPAVTTRSSLRRT
jgi:hypothetical protein